MSEHLVIFDLDGVLVDTGKVMKEAFSTAYAAVAGAGPPPFAEYRRYLGAPLDEIVRKMKLPPNMGPHFREASKRLAHLVRPYPRIISVLDLFKKHEYTLALFTGKDFDRTRDLLQRLRMERFFDSIVTGDDVKKGKPDPEGLLQILERTNTEAQRALFVGDSTYDIVCARRAEVPSIGVSWGLTKAGMLARARPTFLIHCPQDLFPVVAAVLRPSSPHRRNSSSSDELRTNN